MLGAGAVATVLDGELLLLSVKGWVGVLERLERELVELYEVVTSPAGGLRSLVEVFGSADTACSFWERSSSLTGGITGLSVSNAEVSNLEVL